MIAADEALSAQAIEAGAALPIFWAAARACTELGGAPLLWTVTILAALLLWRRSLPRRALLLVFTVVLGRLSVEALKATLARPRPELVEHPVFTHSLSMPSGHAANSMVVYLSVALLLAAPRHRRAAVLAGMALSLLAGATRPVLGVHWPSDVLAGWLWGAGWTLVALALGARWAEGDRVRPPSASV